MCINWTYKETINAENQKRSNLSDRILLFTALVPTLVLISFVSSFVWPYLDVLILGKDRI